MPFLRRVDRLTYERAHNTWQLRGPDDINVPPPDRLEYGWFTDFEDREAARNRRREREAREQAELRRAIPPIGQAQVQLRDLDDLAAAQNAWVHIAPPQEPPPQPVPVVDAAAPPADVQGFIDRLVAQRPPAARLRRDPDMPNNRQYLKDFPKLNLDKVPDGPKILRAVNLPPFKVDYDSHEQISTKLRGSVIMIKDNPFNVVDTIEAQDGFALLIRDYKGTTSWIMYDDVKDFRGIAPGYVNFQNAAYWVYRVPERQNRQGMTNANTHSRLAGTDFVQGARTDFLLTALSTRKDIEYAGNLVSLMEAGALSSIRLSNEIALYRSKTKGAPVGVEYYGRKIGLIVKDQVKVYDENDLIPSWINKDFMAVNLTLAA